MYSVDHQDRVSELANIPKCSAGAPCPMVLASDDQLILCYYLQNTPPGWDGRSVREVGPDSPGEPAAVVRFVDPCASMFGPPNDEAFSGHPLAARGLHAYGAFEVVNSSWIRRLEKMNSVHPYHRKESYDSLRHFILSFHDSTFECVASGYESKLETGPLTRLMAQVALAAGE
jgi:hypothetical protein